MAYFRETAPKARLEDVVAKAEGKFVERLVNRTIKTGDQQAFVRARGFSTGMLGRRPEDMPPMLDANISWRDELLARRITRFRRRFGEDALARVGVGFDSEMNALWHARYHSAPSTLPLFLEPIPTVLPAIPTVGEPYATESPAISTVTDAIPTESPYGHRFEDRQES